MMQNNKRFFPNKLPLAAAVTAAIMATPAIAVDFHGYARSGLSTNTSSGGEQTCFGSGANGHFVGRLADECDTYAELAFGDQLFSQDGKTFRFDSMVSYEAINQGNDYQAFDGADDVNGVDFAGEETTRNNGNPYSGCEVAVRQLYVSGTNVIESLPGATLWAGKRFYKRHDVHQLDLFYINNSGYGAGVENIQAGAGQFSAAWINFDKQESDTIVQNNKLDLRYAFPVGESTLTLAGIYGMADLTDEQEAAGIMDEDGFFGTIELSSGFMGGFNKFVLQYATDSLGEAAFANQGCNASLNAPYYDGTLEKSWRVLNHGVVKLGGPWELGYSALYSKGETYGPINEEEPTRLSVVARPIYNWNSVTSTALEIGYEDVHHPYNDEETDLQKVAIAQQWSAGPGYWARPVIRAYAAAFFGDQAEAARSEGIDGDIQIGAQIEAWW